MGLGFYFWKQNISKTIQQVQLSMNNLQVWVTDYHQDKFDHASILQLKFKCHV